MLYLMQTMYTLDLESSNGPCPDPLTGGLSLDLTYRVSGGGVGRVHTSDIQTAMMNAGIGPAWGPGRKYRIVWVDGSTFMVATERPTDDGDDGDDDEEDSEDDEDVDDNDDDDDLDEVEDGGGDGDGDNDAARYEGADRPGPDTGIPPIGRSRTRSPRRPPASSSSVGTLSSSSSLESSRSSSRSSSSSMSESSSSAAIALAKMERRGRAVLSALRENFPGADEISTLREYLEMRAWEEVEAEAWGGGDGRGRRRKTRGGGRIGGGPRRRRRPAPPGAADAPRRGG